MFETLASTETLRENVLGELSDAAFQVSARYGVKGVSVDNELAIWRALGEVIEEQAKLGKADGERPRGKIRLEHSVAQLTEAAYQVVLDHGFRGSFIDVQLDLWKALCQVVRKSRTDAILPGLSGAGPEACGGELPSKKARSFPQRPVPVGIAWPPAGGRGGRRNGVGRGTFRKSLATIQVVSYSPCPSKICSWSAPATLARLLEFSVEDRRRGDAEQIQDRSRGDRMIIQHEVGLGKGGMVISAPASLCS